MKIHVISDGKGKVLGSFHHNHAASKDAPNVGLFTPLNGQKVHDLDVPQEIAGIKDTTELHKAIEKHLKEYK